MSLILINANSLHIPLADQSVQMCVTSPPYYGLRDYGTATWEGGDPDCEHIETFRPQRNHNGRNFGTGRGGETAKETTKIAYRDVCADCGAVRIDKQIGLEETPEQYVENMVAVFREVKRVLKEDGVLFLNIGDSYAGSWGNYGGQNRGNGKQREIISGSSVTQKAYEGKESWKPPTANNLGGGIKPKDLIGIPWMLAFALRADGWWLRQDVIEEVELYCPCGCGYVLEERIWRWSQDRDMIWHKPNPMPESVKDRCTKAHEYVFLLSKSAKYYYDADAIAEQANTSELEYRNNVRENKDYSMKKPYDKNFPMSYKNTQTRNKRSVWEISTKPYAGAHFATFPPELPELCIKAGSKPGDIVLDPFNGAATTGLVSRILGRNYVGLDLSVEYLNLSRERLLLSALEAYSNGKKAEANYNDLPMFQELL